MSFYKMPKQAEATQFVERCVFPSGSAWGLRYPEHLMKLING